MGALTQTGISPHPQLQTVWAAVEAGLPGCRGVGRALTAWPHSTQGAAQVQTSQRLRSSAQSQLPLRLGRTALKVRRGGEGEEGSGEREARARALGIYVSMCTVEIFYNSPLELP